MNDNSLLYSSNEWRLHCCMLSQVKFCLLERQTQASCHYLLSIMGPNILKFYGNTLVINYLCETMSVQGPISPTVFSIAIQTRWTFRYTLTPILTWWLLQNFAHGSTAQLWWHVQNNCCKMMARWRNTTTQSSPQNWVVGKKSLVKQAAGGFTKEQVSNEEPWCILCCDHR